MEGYWELHRRHLAQADRHIAQLKDIIARREQIVDKLRSKGMQHEEAMDTLVTLKETLSLLERHREIILESLKQAG